MKKKAGQNLKSGKETKQETMAIGNLKYEVGQEMGISPKTKNKKS